MHTSPPRRARAPTPPEPNTEILGVSPAIEDVRQQIALLGPSDVPVHIFAPSGTGKELVARALHHASGRPGSYVAMNCGSIPESLAESLLFGHVRGAFTDAHADRAGLFEEAHAGTLVLDEIDKLVPRAQGCLLRVLDDGHVCRVGSTQALPVNVRLLTISNRDLKRLAESGEFLWDLYWRVMGPMIVIPPLRDRPEDIPILARQYLQRSSLSDEACGILIRHDWHGNVRELGMVITHAELLAGGGEILPEHVSAALGRPDEEVAPGARSFNLEASKKAVVRAALEAADWNVSRAAELLGVDRTTVVRMIERWDWQHPINAR